MMEMREFPTAVILSLSTGILLCGLSDMHEAAEYLMGHPIWTHQFADKQLCQDMKKTILEQCPLMPTTLENVTNENYKEKLNEVESVIGKTVRIRRGSGLTAMLPEDGIPDHLKDKVIKINV